MCSFSIKDVFQINNTSTDINDIYANTYTYRMYIIKYFGLHQVQVIMKLSPSRVIKVI